MVKIDNTMGDIKTGRQGEAVYQRKYGTQIRRTVSPKRTIPSEAQLAHRNLYRAALTWRKSLSLANRRYLDGYCISNGQVDSYHIPLPWSRFALKLCLEKIRFVISDIVETDIEEANTKHQSYEGTRDYYFGFGQARWIAQTFLTTASYLLTSVEVRLYQTGVAGMITVSIRDADAGNKPAGIDLTLGTTDGDTLTDNTWGQWRAIDLTPYQLLANHKYAIVLRAIGAAGITTLRWVGRDTAPLYADGRLCYSMDSGSSWTPDDGKDLFFMTWEYTEASYLKTGLLHVRHPALMTVIHKRGGVIIGGYDTLSSLDEQYLTGQVGLDVVAGDSIEAITLPGIKYCYEVS